MFRAHIPATELMQISHIEFVAPKVCRNVGVTPKALLLAYFECNFDFGQRAHVHAEDVVRFWM
jgi:hypothetical protein